MEYVELHCKSNFSFLEGASHADELIERAAELGYSGLAITDRNTLAGVVRGYTAAKDYNIRFIVGAELHPIDGPPVVVWPQNRSGYGNLSQIITRGRLRREKGAAEVSWADIQELSDGLLVGLLLRKPVVDELPSGEVQRFEDEESMPWEFEGVDESDSAEVRNEILGSASMQSESIPDLPALDFADHEDHGWHAWCDHVTSIFGDRAYLLLELHRGVDDAEKVLRYQQLSKDSGLPLVAAGDVHYHIAERALLHDCLLATRFNTTIDQVVTERLANSQHALRELQQISESYRAVADAVSRSCEIAERIEFTLDQLRYDYPVELAPDGQEPIDFLKRLTWEGAKKRFDGQVPQRVIDMLKHEIGLIEELRYEAYFLTVWDLVRFARTRGILCQGRGSAANSAVCFCLGVTSVDPSQLDLLFERFISRERNEAPDIDVDFEHQRREEVLQYIYDKYGRHRAGMTAAVITYRIRSAIRDVGRALGVSLDSIDALSKLVDGRHKEDSLEQRAEEAGISPDSEVGRRFIYLVQNLLGFPRHLSQHVGGMVMTQDWLCRICPLENASMPGRTVIEWDKDDLDELGILKVDCLSLGMLSAIHRAFDMIEEQYDRPLTLATVPPEDSEVYDMICRADTIGVFQIESRAQMSMLPRLRPRCFYDLVIEVAIVRPGPIQGQMVHPYLTARRSGKQPDYPTPEIGQVLSKTMGVPIFQEQAMRLAVVAAGFTPGEADQLRRAMAAWRRPGLIDQFRQKLMEGMRNQGLSAQFAENVFTQIRGFGEYGFPESHAASFALLVYVSCWLKHHYPEVFCAAIINSQPMGFYAPSQLVQDARKHKVEVLQVDVNSSDWDCKLEVSGQDSRRAVRLGMLMIRGLPEEVGQRVVQARASGLFKDMADFTRRTRLGQAMVTRLADAGAFRSLAGDRRAAYWQALAQDKTNQELTLLEAMGADSDDPLPAALKPMDAIDEVYADYETTGLSLKAHPFSFIEKALVRLRVTAAADLQEADDGKFLRVAGLVLLRQRPSTAKGITFVTLEDATGTLNLVIRPSIWEKFSKVAKRSNAWLVHGVLEHREGVIHILTGRIEDLTTHVGALKTRSRDFR